MNKIYYTLGISIVIFLLNACSSPTEDLNPHSCAREKPDPYPSSKIRAHLLTPAWKRDEKDIPFMSKDLALERMVKYNILGYFLEEFRRYDSALVGYQLNNSTEQLKGYDNTHVYLRHEGLKGIYYLFYNRDDSIKHQLSSTERQEIIQLINIVTDNPKKSKQILAELEKIYQDKYQNKIMSGNLVIANVEYKGRLFELYGTIDIRLDKPHCTEDSLSRFSIN